MPYKIPVKKKFFISPSAKTLYTVRSGRTASTLGTCDQGQVPATPANSASTTSSNLTRKAEEGYAGLPPTSAGSSVEGAAPPAAAAADTSTVPVAKEVSASATAPAAPMETSIVPAHPTANLPPPSDTHPPAAVATFTIVKDRSAGTFKATPFANHADDPPIPLVHPVATSPNTAVVREEALARPRAASPSSISSQKAKVYPASNGSFEEALPRSQKQEDYSYPPAPATTGAPASHPAGEEKSRDLASSGTKAKYMAKATMWWAEFRMKHPFKKAKA